MEGVLHGYSLKVKRFCRQRSANAFGQGTPHGGTGLEGSQHDHRFDGSACQLRSDVVRDAREPDHLNLQALTGSHRAFKILSSYVLQAHGESALPPPASRHWRAGPTDCARPCGQDPSGLCRSLPAPTGRRDQYLPCPLSGHLFGLATLLFQFRAWELSFIASI
jgi:hypothetical protein